MNPGGPALVVGVAGGSASGKTTLVRALQDLMGATELGLLLHDWYYHDLSHLPRSERISTNFDHPSAIDTSLLLAHLDALAQGESVETPRYDFATQVRSPETHTLIPTRVLVVEGNLVLALPALRSRFGLKVFLDSSREERSERRLRRDLAERGQSREDILAQYVESVEPMYDQFVDPSKRWADLIVPAGAPPAAESVLALLCERLVQQR